VNPVVVGLHHITWRATASGIADETVVADAIAWLVGDPELVEIEPTTSYHGSKLHMVTGVCKKKAHSLKSLSRIGTECLQTLLEEVDDRFDENHTLYFRIDFDAFIDGEVVLATSGQVATIKCHTKIEVYPGQVAIEECRNVLKLALENIQTEG
jgi:RNA binding exosome subunit